MNMSNIQLKPGPDSSEPMPNKFQNFNVNDSIKWSWALRHLEPSQVYCLQDKIRIKPKTGDVGLVRISRIKNHTRLMTSGGERLRLHLNDLMVGVFGHRYATDAYEAEVQDLDQLHLVTNAGMMSTVLSKHERIKSPTQLAFLGYLTGDAGQVINIKQKVFPAKMPDNTNKKVVLVVGSGMNSGKTSTGANLVKGLLNQGLRVAACKLTGSVSPGDLYEYYSTAAPDVRDFSDYGFPSTYLIEREELIGLFYAMMADSAKVQPDLIVMEIADGVLQRETKMLLQAEEVRQHVHGVLLTAACAGSALFGASKIESYGHTVLGVSGLITNSPLYMREFCEQSPLSLASSIGDGGELAELVKSRLPQVS